jgi:hypothetical protein
MAPRDGLQGRIRPDKKDDDFEEFPESDEEVSENGALEAESIEAGSESLESEDESDPSISTSKGSDDEVRFLDVQNTSLLTISTGNCLTANRGHKPHSTYIIWGSRLSAGVSYAEAEARWYFYSGPVPDACARTLIVAFPRGHRAPCWRAASLFGPRITVLQACAYRNVVQARRQS